MMRSNQNNPKKTFKFFVVFVVIIIIFMIPTKLAWRNMEKNPIYKIGTITKIEYVGKSVDNRVCFNYNNEKGSNYFLDDSTTIYKRNIGKRFLVKMSDKEWINSLFFTYKLYINIPVPDSIKEAPPEGWKEMPAWAKKIQMDKK